MPLITGHWKVKVLRSMDPLGALASIITVVQLTLIVPKYLNGIGSSSKDREKICSELCGMNEMLCILCAKATQAQQGDSWSKPFKCFCAANGPLEQYKRTLEKLEKEVQPSRGSKKVITAIAWPFRKGEVQDLLDSIERQKNMFNFAQQNDHM